MGDLRKRVISPHNGVDAFWEAVSSVVRDRAFSVELSWRMFIRDTKVLFRGSFLGWFWLIVPTLSNSLLWIFLSGSNLVRIQSGVVPYPIFVFVGNLLWTAFNGCLVGGLGVLGEAQGALPKVSFPHECLLLLVLLKNLLNVLLTSLMLPVFLLLFDVDYRAEMLLFPLGVLLTMLCGLSLGVMLVPVGALFQDLSRAVHLGLRFGFFITPVIFPLPASGTARSVMLLNPATSLIVTSRGWLLGGEQADVRVFLIVSAASFLVLLFGIVALKVSLPHIIERTAGG